MGCSPSRVLPEQITAVSDEPVAAPIVVVAEASLPSSGAAASSSSAAGDNEVQPFRPASSSMSHTPAASMEPSAAILRPTHHTQLSQSLRPSEFSTSHTQQSTPRSQQAQLSPSSQRQQQQPPLFAPPAASSAPRVSILKVPGDKKKKDWDAIRAAKQAIVSPHHGHKSSAVLEEKEQLDELAEATSTTTNATTQQHVHMQQQQGAEEHKEQQTPSGPARAIFRTQSSSSQLSQPHRLTRPQSIPLSSGAPTSDSPPSQSPSHGRDAASKPAKPGTGSAATSRQNSFRTGAGKKKKRRTSHQGMMSKLALQFPAVRASFAAVYSSFQQFCHMSAPLSPAGTDTGTSTGTGASPTLPTSISALGHISLEKFPALLAHLTHHACTFTDEQVSQLFALSHVEHSPTLTFRECLIAVALGYYLAPQSASHASSASSHSVSTVTADPNFERHSRGFRVIRSAFEEIDDDNSGMLSADEMKQALFAASSGQSKDDVLQARFMELDINGDGDVEFKEFLYGVASWVGMTSEEELDDIEQTA